MKCKIESLCCEKRPGERPDFCDELCEEFVPADLPEAGASAERISSVVRSGADIEDTMLKVIQERDYLIEQLYKIYQHKDWLNMPDIVKEAVIFGLEKVSIKDGGEE